MSILIDITNPRELTRAIQKVNTVQPFMFDTFFGSKKEFHVTDTIDIEIQSNNTKLAQYVNTHEGAKQIQKSTTRVVKTVKLPRTYESKFYTAADLAKFQVLRNAYVTSSADLTTQANQNIMRELQDLKARVYRRWEQMTCEALTTGKITVSNDSVAWEVDYGYIADTHTKTLSGSDKWNTSTAKIGQNLTDWQMQILELSGTNADICIVGSDVAKAIRDNEKLMKELNNFNFKVGALDFTQKLNIGGNRLGVLSNGLQIFSYNQKYQDNAGAKQNMIGANQVILASTQNDGFRMHYGPSLRLTPQGELQVASGEMLVESFVDPKKTFVEWTCEQHGLPAIHDPDALVVATVL